MSRFISYNDVEHFLNSIPMFGKAGSQAARFELGRMHKLLGVIGNPHKNFKSVHVAGTNGKGTVCRLLASVYQQGGYKTGLYTSPHLIDYRDRFLVNGRRMEKEELLFFFQEYENLILSEQCTYFELSTAIAFWYFSQKSVDIAIIETGLGGRLDATNVIQPNVSVITSVGLDHTDLLGNTLPEIAAEKAGIIKNATPVVIGKLKPEAQETVLRIAKEKNSAVSNSADAEYIFEDNSLGFLLPDQQKMMVPADAWKPVDAYNFRIAWEATTLLQKELPISTAEFYDGIIHVNERFRNRAVFQRVSNQEEWFFDGAHNPDAVAALIHKLLSIAPAQNWNVVLSFMNDKLTADVARLWSRFPNIYLFDMDTQRAASIARMTEFLPHGKPLGSNYSAQINQFKSSLVIFSGSFYFYTIVSNWMGTSSA